MSRSPSLGPVAALLAASLGTFVPTLAGAAEFTERLSTDTGGAELSRASATPDIDAGGRFTAFVTSAGGVAPGGTGGKLQVYVRERRSGVVERVSVDAGGTAGNGDSFAPSISADGRFVAFASLSTNLAAGDANTRSDVYLRDRLRGETRLVSATTGNSAANGPSRQPSISEDGRFVAYASEAGNIVPPDTNTFSDVFVFDRVAGTTERVSDADDGGEGDGDSEKPDVSADGRRVAFVSAASNLVADDTDDRPDAFVRDRVAGTTVRANLQANGAPGGAGVSFARISDDGARVAFFAKGSGLATGSTDRDVYVKTLDSGAIEAFATGDLAPSDGAYDIDAIDIDAGGCRVAFELVSRDAGEPPAAWLRDCDDGSFREVGAGAFAPSIDAAGRDVAFVSASGALVADDGNGVADAFLLDTGDACPVDAARLVRTLKNDTWTMLSLPCEPPPGSDTLADVFDELDADEIDETFAVFTFVASGAGAGRYVRATADTRLRTGEGFWINQRTGSDLDVRLPAGSNRVPRDTASLSCEAPDGCWRVTLSGDLSRTPWNLVGNPFDRAVPIGDVVTSAPDGPCESPAGCTFAQATDEGGPNLLDAPFARWDDELAVPDYEPLGDGDELPPWSAVWVRELGGAAGNVPVLDLPYED